MTTANRLTGLAGLTASAFTAISWFAGGGTKTVDAAKSLFAIAGVLTSVAWSADAGFVFKVVTALACGAAFAVTAVHRDGCGDALAFAALLSLGTVTTFGAGAIELRLTFDVAFVCPTVCDHLVVFGTFACRFVVTTTTTRRHGHQKKAEQER